MQVAKVLWLIPARSGSKGVPGKNIKNLAGRPLLAWRIESVKDILTSGSVIWISTDSKKYAKIGEKFGAKAPFLRPSTISLDTTSSYEVCLHAMHFALARGLIFDYIAMLQPTSPFVTKSTLEIGLQLLYKNKEALAVVACRYVSTSSYLIQKEAPYLDILAERFSNFHSVRRQDLPTEITPCGGLYLMRWDAFLRYKTFYTKKTIPIILKGIEALDIDTEEDFSLATFYAKQLTEGL